MIEEGFTKRELARLCRRGYRGVAYRRSNGASLVFLHDAAALDDSRPVSHATAATRFAALRRAADEADVAQRCPCGGCLDLHAYCVRCYSPVREQALDAIAGEAR